MGFPDNLKVVNKIGLNSILQIEKYNLNKKTFHPGEAIYPGKNNKNLN